MNLLDICQKISKLIPSFSEDGLEIEVKLRNITEDEFFYILKYLQHLYKEEKENTTDYYIKEKRITEKDNAFYETSKKSLIEPTFLKVSGRELKFTIANEESKKLSVKSIRKYNFVRIKKRSSFQIGNFKIDLTEVTRDKKKDYEVEIEVIDTGLYQPEKFSSIILEYIDVLQMEQINVVSFCNNYLSGGKSVSNDKIDRKFVSRPRDLLKNDVTSPNSILRGFAVSIKADGVPYFLVFFKNRIFLVDYKGKVDDLCPIPEKYSTLDNTIFVGELIERSKLKKESYTDFMNIYLPFDTIVYKGSSFINKNYLERFEISNEIKGMEIFCEGIKKVKIEEKKIFNLGMKSDDFYESFNKCYDEKKNIIYEDDGYILTPINSPFIAEGQTHPKRERILSKFLDVCKFKPLEKRSIDFIVKDGKIYSYDNRKGKLVEFNKIKFTLEFSEDIDDKIVEFFPNFTTKGVILKPSRIRSDKEYPNETETVDEISRSYTENNPITEDTLRGKDTTLMRAFNNFYIKGRLIKSLEGYVVDIGSGKGGDIAKFGGNNKIEKILSVEPNKEFANEFEERLKKSKFEKKFKLLKDVKGEDKDEIIREMNFFPENMEDKILNITFMISLSFFWSSEENLLNLADTINSITKEYKRRKGNRNINLVFFTINGYQVEKYFKKLGKLEVNLNTINLIFDGKNQLEVEIKDSKTVPRQTEYLVKLDQLFDLISAEEIEVKNPKVFNMLMSGPELTYLSLFSFGSVKLSREVELIYPPERINVNEDIGIDIDDKILAKGEDTISSVPYLGENIYRVGTLDQGDSYYHSILKLISEEYREGDVYKRLELVNNMDKSKINYKIIVYEGDIKKLINRKKENVINLNKCRDGTYEPLITIEGGDVIYSFEK